MRLGVATDRGPGKFTFTTVPGGANTRIGRKQSEFFGMVESVSCRIAL
jgi:hypothetical protein